MSQSPAGLLGFSHLLGGFPGGQAEYLRVPFADVGPVQDSSGRATSRLLFLSDIFPTGYMAAENAEIEPGETVAIWGCGAVGQFAIKSAWMLDAGRVIAIDRVPERLRMAESRARRDDQLRGRRRLRAADGPHERARAGPVHRRGGDGGHGRGSVDAMFDKRKWRHTWAPTDRTPCARRSCVAARGTISVPGVYIGFLDKIPFGPRWARG